MKNKIFFIADTHFFHKNIITYCNRPFNDEVSMNEFIIEKWNTTIDKDCVVFHLGDVAANLQGRVEELKKIIDRLNGTKYLIRGNHDHLTNEEYKNIGFLNVYDYFKLNDLFLTHVPAVKEYKAQGHSYSKMFSSLSKEQHMFNLFGHVHDKNVKTEFGYNCSIENLQYTPISLEKILRLKEVNARN